MNKERLLAEVDRLLEKGNGVLATNQESTLGIEDFVDGRAFSKWLPSCRNVLRLLGREAEPWSEPFSESAEYYSFHRANRMQATLESLREAIENDLLLTVEEFVLADAFDSLLEQAEYLHEGGYFLAGGVLGRAVLEEHLRKWTEHAECVPEKTRPTINDFTQALYQGKHLNKLALKHVESMAAIGNDAAHNKPELTSNDVERLLRDVRDFVTRHPISTV